MIQTLLGIFIGIILGITIEKYIFPILDIEFDVFQIKQSDIANKYNLSSQESTFKFFRKYPEASQINEQQNVDAVGYMVNEDEDEDDDCDDGIYLKKKRRIGFIE